MNLGKMDLGIKAEVSPSSMSWPMPGLILRTIGLCISLSFLPSTVWAEMHGMGPNTLWQTPADCGEMSVWNVEMGMCMPLPMADMPMRMAMLRGNIFGTRIWQSGPRGRADFASSSMVMGDLGTSVGDHHYLNLDLMLTAEKWLFPNSGYPLLLQIGEHNLQGAPFIDAQHSHSSPIMGLTFSDTIAWGIEKNHLKLYFAPRGQATEDPVAFMHRSTGMANPDAPLGHHIGHSEYSSYWIHSELWRQPRCFVPKQISAGEGTYPFCSNRNSESL